MVMTFHLTCLACLRQGEDGLFHLGNRWFGVQQEPQILSHAFPEQIYGVLSKT